MTHVLELKDVTVNRQGKNILDNVSWHTSHGEHWVILGPNGAGKTTMARLIGGRALADSGEVLLDGEKIDSLAPAEVATRVGFASASLLSKIRPQTRVEDLVKTAAWGVHIPLEQSYEEIDEERAANLMEIFGLAHVARQEFRSISQGEAARLLLARAMMSDPEVLVLDEPTAGLDIGGREMVMGALDEIIEGAASPQILLITHQIEEIPTNITHAALMAGGTIQAAGPIDTVITGVALSQAFSLPLVAGRRDGRWWAHGL